MTIKSFVKFLITNNGWKSAGASALVCLGLLVVFNSFLFDLTVGLIKILLTLGVIGFTAQTVWLAYPLLKSKYMS